MNVRSDLVILIFSVKSSSISEYTVTNINDLAYNHACRISDMLHYRISAFLLQYFKPFTSSLFFYETVSCVIWYHYRNFSPASSTYDALLRCSFVFHTRPNFVDKYGFSFADNAFTNQSSLLKCVLYGAAWYWLTCMQWPLLLTWINFNPNMDK